MYKEGGEQLWTCESVPVCNHWWHPTPAMPQCNSAQLDPFRRTVSCSVCISPSAAAAGTAAAAARSCARLSLAW
jgi:hypothetical protein